MAKIIITSAVFDRYDQELLAIMGDAGHEVHFNTITHNVRPTSCWSYWKVCPRRLLASTRSRPR